MKKKAIVALAEAEAKQDVELAGGAAFGVEAYNALCGSKDKEEAWDRRREAILVKLTPFVKKHHRKNGEPSAQLIDALVLFHNAYWSELDYLNDVEAYEAWRKKMNGA